MKQLNANILKLAHAACASSIKLANATTLQKNNALNLMAANLVNNSSYLLKENGKDLDFAKKSGSSPVLIDRLRLTLERIKEMSQGLRQIAQLPDPVGQVIKQWHRPNGLLIKKVRVPIGVIAIIYESRPNVTCDCAGLCLKSGNSVILRGGKEAFNSNSAIFKIMNDSIIKAGLPQGAINFVNTTEHQAVNVMLKMADLIDLVIPRGGPALIRQVAKLSAIPVIKHYMGICHTYVDAGADLHLAERVCFNAKVQRPATCNAMETMLVHRSIARKFLPVMLKKFIASNVEIRGCKITKSIVPTVLLAKDKDYHTEYLDLILSVKVVNNIDEAIRHISEYGSKHSDAIITANKKAADYFVKTVDSACVYVNTSTRFTDGYQFGMGAEMGISTDKIHARGPMGLEELTSYKYEVFGHGQIRS